MINCFHFLLILQKRYAMHKKKEFLKYIFSREKQFAIILFEKKKEKKSYLKIIMDT